MSSSSRGPEPEYENTLGETLKDTKAINSVTKKTKTQKTDLKLEDVGRKFMELLEPLNSTWIFIIQPKVDDYGLVIADFFHPNTTHEIYSDKRHLFFKGSFKRKLILPLALKKNNNGGSSTTPSGSSGTRRKISIANLKQKKIASVEFEQSALANEAIIHCPPGTARGRVIKYGGKYEHPSYSITCPESANESKVLFSVENSPSNSTSGSSTTLDYNIFRPNNKLVGRVTSKSGLNFMVHIVEGVGPLDKAIILGFVIAMDMLKQVGKSMKKSNEYEYND